MILEGIDIDAVVRIVRYPFTFHLYFVLLDSNIPDIITRLLSLASKFTRNINFGDSVSFFKSNYSGLDIYIIISLYFNTETTKVAVQVTNL